MLLREEENQGMSTAKLKRAFLGGIALMGIVHAAASLAADPTDASGSAPSAVWTPKEFTFVYQGFTSRYSCDGLRSKVRTALLQLGADPKGLKVSEYGCSSPFGTPDPFPGVRVKMSVLQPAGSDANSASVPAQWKPVNLKIDDPGEFADSGNCELMEQIHSKIVPLFATRNVEYNTNCIPHQATVIGTTLKLETLQPEKPAPNR
jgi:hypothetical protein